MRKPFAVANVHGVLPMTASDKQKEELIFGKNAVLAFLTRPLLNDGNSGQAAINKIFVASGLQADSRVERIQQLAKARHVPIVICDRRRLAQMVGENQSHQGIVAQISATDILSFDQFLRQLSIVKDSSESMDGYVIIIPDGMEDPRNLGAIVRVAEASGVKAILLPARRGAQVTGTVAKTSAGALANLQVVRITNTVRTLDKLKELGFWTAGLDAEAKQVYFDADLVRPLVLVVGSEGKGLSRLVREHCDMLLAIPMLGKAESLNASVATGIVLYETVRQLNRVRGKILQHYRN